MKFIYSKSFKTVLFVILLIWIGINLSYKIDLTTADLGRHLQNGKILISDSSEIKKTLLTQNFYSYTMPQQEFINHHWLTGVIFYLIYSIFSFEGLSVSYILLSILSVAFVFDVARKKSNFWLALLVSILVLPIIVKRTEIRPEVFTYFLSAFFVWIIDLAQVSKVRLKHLWILPILMILWVNLHIGFVFGFLILGAFGLMNLISYFRKKTNIFKRLLIVSVGSVIAAFFNPNFIKGAIYPFRIFENYGYRIVENQSIMFLEGISFTSGQHFLLIRILILSLISSLIYLLVKKRAKVNLAISLLALISAIMAIMAIRNFPIFALFLIPALAYQIYNTYPTKPVLEVRQIAITFGVIIAFFMIINQFSIRGIKSNDSGIGLLTNVNDSIDFYKSNKLEGPIFNNYDLGGYLIYHLYPEKVYVDNRPEAYTVRFFEKEYILPQEKIQEFRKLDQKFNFNVVFFSHRDYTPWGQSFLVSMLNNDKWAPVYVDNYNIIFLKRNLNNQSLIEKFELPEGQLKISNTQ